MFRGLLLIMKKDFQETVANKRKLWPFIVALIPIFIFFYTKGSQSLFPVETSLYYLSVVLSSVIAMQLSSISILDEKKYKMLDVMLAMNIKPITIVLAKTIFSTIFTSIIGFFIILGIKYAGIFVFNKDMLIINLSYVLFVVLILYYSSIVSICTSIIIKEQSLIPLVSTIVTFLPIVGIYYILDLKSNFKLFEVGLAVVMIMIVSLITYLGSLLIKKTKFIISI